MELEDIQCVDDIERLVLLRRRLGIKQYQFARMIGISRRQLIAIENYQKPISVPIRQKINRFLNRIEKEREDELHV